MRIVRNGSGYELVQLDRKVKNRVLRSLRGRNLQLMRKCLIDADKLLHELGPSWADEKVAAIAVALFEKLATKSFTELAATETRVVHELKETWKAKKQLDVVDRT